jgi:hypothetical protein
VRTPSCPTPTRRWNTRFSRCGKAQVAAGLDDDAFDSDPADSWPCPGGGVRAGEGLLRDLRRILERAWVVHTGADPYAGGIWQVCLLDMYSNGSRRSPATRRGRSQADRARLVAGRC